MKILILGAAGQISRMLTDRLLKETNAELVLYARDGRNRINKDSDRIEIIDGDFKDKTNLLKAMKDVDYVYLNDVNSNVATNNVVDAALQSGVKKLIAASILGIYDEVGGAFGEWNAMMVGKPDTDRHKKSAEIIESSNLDYTILRLTWLYNQNGNENYMLTQKGESFIGAQVSRQAVARLIIDIIQNPNMYVKTSLGVSEPNTDFSKPSFY